MAINQISKIQIRNGPSPLPQLSPGELGYATDTKQLFIGNDGVSDNTEILTAISGLPSAGNNKQVMFNSQGHASTVGSVTGANINNIFSYDYEAGTINSIGGRGLLTVNNIDVVNMLNTNALNVTGDASVTGNLSVLGNITFVNQQSLSLDDPVIDLGANSAVSSRANFAAGVMMSYYNGAPERAFMGYLPGAGTPANSFVLLSTVTSESDTNITGVLGDLKVGNLIATGTVSGGFQSVGSNTQVMFNDSGIAGAFVGFTFDKTSNTVTSANSFVAPNLIASTNLSAVNAVVSGNMTVVGTLTANVTATSLAVSGNVTIGNLNVTGASNLGPVANVHITGGNSGQILTTDGAGNLSWTTVVSGLSNGTSGITIPTINSNVITTVGGNASFTVTTVGANVLGTLNISSSVQVANITTGANTTAGAITGNWTLTTGSRLNATYADIGERYTTDQKYTPGTVLMIGGPKETTIATYAGRYSLAGVVSTEPAYVLNSDQTDSVVIALVGRVPCQVTGNISKGDMLTISNIDGVATASLAKEHGTIIGRALESYNSTTVGIIEIKVDRA